MIHTCKVKTPERQGCVIGEEEMDPVEITTHLKFIPVYGTQLRTDEWCVDSAFNYHCTTSDCTSGDAESTFWR